MIKNIEDVTCGFLQGRDLICFSHLRWAFVYQRPQHLLSRFARHTRVFYIEEPVFQEGPDRLEVQQPEQQLYVVVPHLQQDKSEAVEGRLQQLVLDLLPAHNIQRYFCWYYTPMALSFTSQLQPEFVVYDCMDELSAFKFAPPELKEREQQLLQRADVVFTGGYSIYEAKKDRHANIHPFPSSIDKHHFLQARAPQSDPDDQAAIPHPRLGFIGVIDERMDIDLVAQAAAARPQWQFVMIGPVVKIDPASLPQLPNLHYLGGKTYSELPRYIAGWDIALIPFALNESTQFISPTKTPEYLAAGKPVISTPIRDVVRPYGDQGLVRIAATAGEWVAQAEAELNTPEKTAWLEQVDAFLADQSWDRTWSGMVRQLEALTEASETNHSVSVNKKAYV
ncbi:glycosyltransferase family 1 protein [Paraflavisolibacter sp. H34]|uniref:glycosyltransferase family 1 protein n=1 Tax=Huijunlia imazamoxiresistens TaxID=3127457 RepID=UPI0030194CDD